jgi:hypothetical protein
MGRFSRFRPSPAMVVAIIALVASTTGTAVGAQLITERIIAKGVTEKLLAANAVTSPKVKNGSLLRKDFRSGQLPAGPQGPQGPRGPQGPEGAMGPAGAPNPNADNSQKLQGHAAIHFAQATNHGRSSADSCTTIGLGGPFAECAWVEVVVPEGKTYHVSVWSSASWLGSTTQAREICSAARKTAPAPAEPNPTCITPFEVFDRITSTAGARRSATSLGEATVGTGTWRFSTGVRAETSASAFSDQNHIITKILVRDAATGAPVGAESAE